MVLAVAGILLAGCGTDASQKGLTGTGSTTPGPAPQGVLPADTPGRTGPPQTGSDPGRVASPLAGAADPGSGTPGGAGVTPKAPGVIALQILGIPVNALPPDVIAAASPPTNEGAGAGTGLTGGATNPDGGTNPAGGTNPGGGTNPAGGTNPGGGTDPVGGTTGGGGTNAGGGANPGGGTNGGGTTGGGTNAGGGGGTSSPPPIPTSTAFCGPARDLSGALNAVGAAEDSASLRSAVAWARRSFVTAHATAPSGLQGDIDVLDNAFSQLFDGMESVDYDRSRVPPSAFSGLLSSDAKTAQDRFNSYVINVC
jgi:hypothetical protein